MGVSGRISKEALYMVTLDLKIYQVYGSPIFERIYVHIQRYLHEAFKEKI
jgi:hypothetical protein